MLNCLFAGYGKLLPAILTAVSKHPTSVGCCHTLAESVLIFSLCARRLECTFHCSSFKNVCGYTIRLVVPLFFKGLQRCRVFLLNPTPGRQKSFQKHPQPIITMAPKSCLSTLSCSQTRKTAHQQVLPWKLEDQLSKQQPGALRLSSAT